ncbi:Djdp [Artaxa digramma nucleopolyhedrovirus]|uniref:Djdp n=1 Tax=Artaxa digramma nucleopolyhedrovirus TaxID=3070910 RepID=A0AAE6V0E9_9ABAC|nr:Djdp [Euproctis digramma nucleopolyhedrovirus]QHB21684.1 Djdp [Artaxa digramma nucleopolyhedrovirus]
MDLRSRRITAAADGSIARTLSVKPQITKFKSPSSLSTKTPAPLSTVRKKPDLIKTAASRTKLKSPTQLVFVDTTDNETDNEINMSNDNDDYEYDDYGFNYGVATPAAVSISLARKRQSTGSLLNGDGNDRTKLIKLGSLYEKNLLSLNFYEIFDVDADDVNFNFMLNNSYELLEKMYSSVNTTPSDAQNSAQTVMDTIIFAYSVLTNPALRSIYDKFLSIKDSQLFKNVRDQLQNYDKSLETLAYDVLKPLRVQIERLVNNDVVHAALMQHFVKKHSAAVQMRPAALNRILITWILHSRNTNNENVTIESLQQYFKAYGHINGIVMCQKKKNCALLEFSSSSSVTRVLTESKGIYKITPLNKWTLNAETLSKLKSILNRITVLEKRFLLYQNINSMII